MSKSSGTAWVIPENGLQMFRATCLIEEAMFEMARGGRPYFNPETARYATSDMVSNIAANIGLTIRGDVASARQFAKGEHAWKQLMTLDELIAHPYLGVSMPSKDKIVAAYKALDVEIEA